MEAQAVEGRTEQLVKLLRSRQRLLVLTHTNPDPDSIGSAIQVTGVINVSHDGTPFDIQTLVKVLAPDEGRSNARDLLITNQRVRLLEITNAMGTRRGHARTLARRALPVLAIQEGRYWALGLKTV